MQKGSSFATKPRRASSCPSASRIRDAPAEPPCLVACRSRAKSFGHSTISSGLTERMPAHSVQSNKFKF
eukprot:5726255-Alexandrium_andersonii.AAC.1